MRPSLQDFEMLQANGDALWDALDEEVPVAEMLGTVPMYRTAGK